MLQQKQKHFSKKLNFCSKIHNYKLLFYYKHFISYIYIIFLFFNLMFNIHYYILFGYFIY